MAPAAPIGEVPSRQPVCYRPATALVGVVRLVRPSSRESLTTAHRARSQQANGSRSRDRPKGPNAWPERVGGHGDLPLRALDSSQFAGNSRANPECATARRPRRRSLRQTRHRACLRRWDRPPREAMTGSFPGSSRGSWPVCPKGQRRWTWTAIRTAEPGRPSFQSFGSTQPFGPRGIPRARPSAEGSRQATVV